MNFPDYRIIVDTERSGKQWFYIQKQFMFFFWVYLKEDGKGMDMSSYKIGWNTLEEARKHIQNLVNYDYAEFQKKIIKREVLTD